jgi:hypothetical protein
MNGNIKKENIRMREVVMKKLVRRAGVQRGSNQIPPTRKSDAVRLSPSVSAATSK